MAITKVWTSTEIRHLVETTNRGVERGILAIYARQTEDEKSLGDTKHLNGRGFSGAHARLGTYYAKHILSGGHLTGDHLFKARKLVLRYIGQLVEVANTKEAKKVLESTSRQLWLGERLTFSR